MVLLWNFVLLFHIIHVKVHIDLRNRIMQKRNVPCMFPCKGRNNFRGTTHLPESMTRTLICLTRITFRTTLCLMYETTNKFGTDSSGGKFDISFELKEAFSRWLPLSGRKRNATVHLHCLSNMHSSYRISEKMSRKISFSPFFPYEFLYFHRRIFLRLALLMLRSLDRTWHFSRSMLW